MSIKQWQKIHMEAYVSQNVNYALDFVTFSQFAYSLPENVKINAFWYFLKHWYHMNLMWTFTLARKVFFLVNVDILIILTRMVQNNTDFAAGSEIFGSTRTDDIIAVKRNYFPGSAFWVCSRHTFFFSNFYTFFAIFPSKIADIWGTIALVSNNSSLSDIPN